MEPVELMGKAAAVAVTAALCGAVLRRGAPELALLLSLLGCGSCWRRGTACGRRPA